MEFNNDFLEDFELDANDHGEPHWLIDRRIEALKQINKLSMPKSHCFANNNVGEITSPQRIRSSKKLLPEESIVDDTICQFGQTVIKNDLPEVMEERGIIVTDIFNSFRIHPRLTQKNFMDKVIAPSEDKASAFHLACINSGVFVYIPKGIKVPAPIKIDLIQDDTRQLLLNTHVLVVVEDDAEVTIEQSLTSFGDYQNKTNLFVEVVSRANSKVNYHLHSHSSSEFVFLKAKSHLSRQAEVEWDVDLNNLGDTWAELSDNLFGSDSQSITRLKSHLDDDQNNRIEEINVSVIEHGKDSKHRLFKDLSSPSSSTITVNGTKY